MDDDPEIIDTLRDGLTYLMPEVEVLTALSGEEGLHVLEREPVDVIVTDYKMPGMDGLEFVKRAHAMHPRMAAILISAFRHSLDPNDLKHAEVAALLEKPFELEAFVAAIGRQLPSRR